MRRVSLLLFLCACSNGSQQTTDDGGSNDVAIEAQVEAGPYLPVGYTQMPFLSDTATYKFKGDGGGAPEQVIDGTHEYVGVLDTDVGRIVMQLYTNVAPITCNSFVFLTLHHFYDGVAFHRVIDGFMAQTGDPNSIKGASTSWGLGNAGYFFGLELDPAYNYDKAGVVGMARGQTTDSNSSQFFITFNAYPSLNQQYTVWAQVIEGLDVLPNIVRGEPPTTPTRIVDAYVGVK